MVATPLKCPGRETPSGISSNPLKYNQDKNIDIN